MRNAVDHKLMPDRQYHAHHWLASTERTQVCIHMQSSRIFRRLNRDHHSNAAKKEKERSVSLDKCCHMRCWNATWIDATDKRHKVFTIGACNVNRIPGRNERRDKLESVASPNVATMLFTKWLSGCRLVCATVVLSI